MTEADRIAADFAEIQFEDHEARKLALAYQELKSVNQCPRDEIRFKVETIILVEVERDRYRDTLRALLSPQERLRIDQGRGLTAFIREVLESEVAV